MAPPMSAETDDAALTRECERLQRRYSVEIVEAFGLCPYAERARLEGRDADVVVVDPAPSDAAVLDAVRALGKDQRVEVAFVIFPRLTIERLALAAWVERLRHAHQAEPGGLVMTMEGFHPDAPPDLSTAGRLVPFLRRTPVPTIQLTRLSSLNRVRRSGPSGTGFVDVHSIDLKAFLAARPAASVSERIAEDNRDKVKEVGVAAIEAVLDDIFRDRDETFARFR